MFFGDENNAKVLRDFIRKADASHIDDEARNKRLNISKQIISYINKSPETWDDRCIFNIKIIGNSFIELISIFDTSKPDIIDDIYFMSYRFLCEFEFLIGAGNELGIDLQLIKNKIQLDNADMPDIVRNQIIYAFYVMPANIVKDFINNPNIGAFRDFEQKKNDAEKLKVQWDGELESKKKATQELKDKLDEYKIGFNFVGLHKGFSDLATQKDKESRSLLWSLIVMGVVILAPLIFEIWTAYIERSKGERLGLDHLIFLAPIISIEAILIYFFRVILLNYRSVKSQLMQIELRQTLCQFIQSYAEYSSKIKKDDAAALEKFENLIFSGILSNSEKLPISFDGLEQITSLIKSVKS